MLGIPDLERSGRRLITKNNIKHVTSVCLSMEPEGRMVLVLMLLFCGYGSFEKVSYGGRVLRSASAMTAERGALRMGIEHLTLYFPTEVSSKFR